MPFVGGGTGIAPVLSIVRGAIAEGMNNPIHLYFGVRSQQDVYDTDRLRQLAKDHSNICINILVATGEAGEMQRKGLMTDALNLLVAHLGVSPEHVYADAFYPSGI